MFHGRKGRPHTIRLRRWAFGSIASAAAIAVLALGASATDESEPTEEAVLDAPEVLVAAEKLGVAPEEAAALLQVQGDFDLYIEPLADHPDFVDYRGPFGEGAVLLVEPGAEDDSAFSNPPPGLEIRAAAASKEERYEGLEQVRALAASIAGDEFRLVTYEPFSNTYTVWLGLGTPISELEPELSGISEALVSNTEASVEVQEVADLRLAKGRTDDNKERPTALHDGIWS